MRGEPLEEQTEFSVGTIIGICSGIGVLIDDTDQTTEIIIEVLNGCILRRRMDCERNDGQRHGA